MADKKVFNTNGGDNTTRWEDLFDFLTSKGYKVYSPSTHSGECTEPYLVIKNSGATKITNVSSEYDLYTIMIYVPAKQYSKLEELRNRVKRDMEGIRPLFITYGFETPSYYDDEIKAHTLSMDYKNYKKIKYIR